LPVRALFFDAGDTLYHHLALKRNRFAFLCRQAGISLPEDGLAAGAVAVERFFQDRSLHRDAWSYPWFLRMYAVGLEAAGVSEGLEEASDRIHRAAMALERPVVIDPEALPVLERLRARGYRLAVVSNNDGTLVDKLRRAGLAGFFDAVLDSDVVACRKPDKRIFSIACLATGTRPEQAIHIGDSPDTDVAGAAEAGIRAVLLDPLDAFADGFRGQPLAAIRIRRLAELPALLEQ
jgi:HAD superfamily hydrolase (TIGR01549 family)